MCREHWFLTGGAHPQGARALTCSALQHGQFLNGNVSRLNSRPVLVLRHHMLFGLVLAEMEVGVKLLKTLQAEFKPA